MPVDEVVDMIFRALRTMAIGISGVFAVLAVFYATLRLMMARTARGGDKEKEE